MSYSAHLNLKRRLNPVAHSSTPSALSQRLKQPQKQPNEEQMKSWEPEEDEILKISLLEIGPRWKEARAHKITSRRRHQPS